MIIIKQKVKDRYKELKDKPKEPFPQLGEKLDVTTKQGVYIIWKGDKPLHVGRTTGGKDGLWQRLKNHLNGQSSFVEKCLLGDRYILRNGSYSYQCHIVKDAKLRAFLEAYATGILCPAHIGLGKEQPKGD